MIKEIYDEIILFNAKKSKRKYIKLIKLYDKTIQTINERHQLEDSVERMSKVFSLENIIKKPTLVGKSFLDDVSFINRYYSRYKFNDEQRELIKKINFVDNNIQKILEQYFIFQFLHSLLLDLPNRYLTRDDYKNYLENYDVVSSDVNKDKTHFYKFMSKDEFKRKLNEHNTNYINKNIDDKLFDDITGKSLDVEQRRAILKDDIASLVIAGAGSGKTLTICGKVSYLLNRKGVDPNDILLLSYSRKSADDLEKKIKVIDKNIKVGTFHKVGLDILKEYYDKNFVIEEQFDAIIEQYFREELKKDRLTLNNLVTFKSLYSYGYEDKHYNDTGELYTDLKRQDLVTLKDRIEHETLKKEKVKSIQELQIANFYFLNGVRYKYETPYKIDLSTKEHRQYCPDFYLQDYGIYHEHYGVNENMQATQYSEEENARYVENMLWKRKVHEKYQTKYIETYSYQFKNGTILDELKKKLEDNGVQLKPLDDREIDEVINSIYEGMDFKSFINLVKSFLSLYKSKYHDESYFEKLKQSSFKNIYQKMRARLFLDICKQIYFYYIKTLRKNDKIDFDDMILKSIGLLDEIKGFKYKYIIVDEFQDISFSRMQFLKALIEHGHARLFAVGDDWQAIYRFSGCDISIFTQFENYFGKASISSITTTHRNSQQLQDVVGPFIRKNKDQINKVIKSNISLDKPIKIVFSEEDKASTFEDALKDISEIDPYAKILVLGRNNNDVTFLDSDLNKVFAKNNVVQIYSTNYPFMDIRFSTVHASKGLEEDFVILINAEDKLLGFPNLLEDDPLLDLVLAKKDAIQYAEERRLFYVALTRTRSYCYVLTTKTSTSPFLKEIMESPHVSRMDFVLGKNIKESSLYETKKTSNHYKCPKCKSGNLVKRVGVNGVFFGCSNYPYCQYTIEDEKVIRANERCPNCGDFLIKKNGKHFTYYTCHNVKYCRYSTYLKEQFKYRTQQKKNKKFYGGGR